MLYRIIKSLHPPINDTDSNDPFIRDEKAFRYESAIIQKLAEEHSCIIVGRCADYILKEYHNVVNVFIRSNMNDRIERATNVYKISMNNASKEIQKMDKKRANYYSFYAHSKWGVAENYDLCINSGRIGIDQSVQVIADYVEFFEAARKAQQK